MTRHRSQYVPLLLLYLSFMLPIWAHAAQPYIACSLPLAPHTMPGPQGEPQGHASELLLAVAKRLGWKLEIRYMPWLRAVDEAKAGHCDLLYTVLRRKDYEDFLVFPDEPIQMRANVLLVRKDSTIRYNGDLATFLRQHSIGMYQDKAVDEHFELLRKEPWVRIDSSVNARQNMEKLVNQRFDAAIENQMTALHELRQLGRSQDVRVLHPPLNVVPAFIALPKAGRLKDAAPIFDAAMTALRKTPEYEAIERKYTEIR